MSNFGPEPAESITERLVRAGLDGDSARFGELYERLAPAVFAWARLRIPVQFRVQIEPDDVLQEAWIRAYRAFDSFDPGRGPFRPWLFQVAKHALLDMVRKAQGRRPKKGEGDSVTKPRRPKIFLDGATGDGFLGQVAGDDSTDPVDLAAWTEFHETVQNLSEKYREVFDLVYYQGLTQQEVADTIGVNVRTVKRYWLSARLELVRKLGGRMPKI